MKRVHQRRGSLLLIVLVAIVLLSLSAYTFTGLMQTEDEAVRLQTRQVQSKYLVDSGVDYVRMYLAQSDDTIRSRGGRWDNAEIFQAIPVAAQNADESNIGYFSIATAALDDEGRADGVRFGLIDESSRINLNTLPYIDALYGNGRTLLLNLPEMTEEIADAILDWIDPDDEVREFGTESSYYQGLNPGYECKNGPMDSLDELLLIRDVTPQLLFGLDTNRNGILDPNEAATNNISITDAELYLGWANYLTLYSKETNLTSEDLPRININADDLEQLYDDLQSAFDDEWANFIIHYRTSETPPTTESPTDEPGVTIIDATSVPPDFETITSQRKFNTVLELMDTFVEVNDPDNLNAFAESPIQFLNMGLTIPTMMASLTTYEGRSIPGRVNIMQAPRLVLLGVPGLDEDLVDQIIDARGDDQELDDPDGADINRRYETWLMVEGIVNRETMIELMPYLCAGGQVYRAEVVGYFSNGAGTSRAEVILDGTEEVPRVLFWRDKSHLQSSFSVDVLGTQLDTLQN